MPMVEELGLSTGNFKVGLFFPPSTFEAYENDGQISTNRTHLKTGGSYHRNTPAEAVNNSNPGLSNTPRIRKIDVVCALGDETQVTPSSYENIPDNYKFEKTITAPRPPVGTEKGGAVYDGINAPVPAIGEINGLGAVTGERDALTCIWRYRYNGDTQEQ